MYRDDALVGVNGEIEVALLEMDRPTLEEGVAHQGLKIRYPEVFGVARVDHFRSLKQAVICRC